MNESGSNPGLLEQAVSAVPEDMSDSKKKLYQAALGMSVEDRAKFKAFLRALLENNPV